MPNVGLIILAAGESRRFGSPKQLARFQGQTLIQRAVQTGLDSMCHSITVVLGANADKIAEHIVGRVNLVVNREWHTGMASSIQRGLQKIGHEVDGVIMMLCDQPMITSEILNRFVRLANNPLVAAEYLDTVGVPAYFSREFFPELLQLTGNAGAKQILARNISRVTRIPCPEAAIDIDLPKDILKANGQQTRTRGD